VSDEEAATAWDAAASEILGEPQLTSFPLCRSRPERGTRSLRRDEPVFVSGFLKSEPPCLTRVSRVDKITIQNFLKVEKTQQNEITFWCFALSQWRYLDGIKWLSCGHSARCRNPSAS
jgi:hypothetical protein